jgi:hypothetical protein
MGGKKAWSFLREMLIFFLLQVKKPGYPIGLLYCANWIAEHQKIQNVNNIDRDQNGGGLCKGNEKSNRKVTR